MTDYNEPDTRQADHGQAAWDIADALPPVIGPSRFSRETQQKLLGENMDLLRGGARYPPAAWTTVTNNSTLVQHLLRLYLCWEYPTFASLSKEHFLLDYNTGRRSFCTPLLMNAILAMGARLTDLKEARKDREDPGSAGDHFFEEAQRLLGVEDLPALTTIQALNLMSLRQASLGNDGSGWHYARSAMRIAIDLDLPHDDPGNQDVETSSPYSQAESQVRAATFWGCVTLEQYVISKSHTFRLSADLARAWSLSIGRTSQISLVDITVKKPIILEELDCERWVPYGDEGFLPDDDRRQDSNERLIFTSFSTISELVHRTTVMLHYEKSSLNGKNVLAHYTEYLQWYEGLPDKLRLGSNSTPVVLLTQ